MGVSSPRHHATCVHGSTGIATCIVSPRTPLRIWQDADVKFRFAWGYGDAPLSMPPTQARRRLSLPWLTWEAPRAIHKAGCLRSWQQPTPDLAPTTVAWADHMRSARGVPLRPIAGSHGLPDRFDADGVAPEHIYMARPPSECSCLAFQYCLVPLRRVQPDRPGSTLKDFAPALSPRCPSAPAPPGCMEYQ